MKKLINFLARKQRKPLVDCTSFKINKEESDMLFGGVREYKPPIYKHEKTAEDSLRTTELFTDFNQTNQS